MTPELFKEILARYNRGLATPEEKNLIDQWFLNLGKEEDVSLEADAEHHLESKYWTTVNQHIQDTKIEGRQKAKSIFLSWPAIAVAAALSLGIVAFVFLQGGPTTQKQKGITAPLAELGMKDVENNTATPALVALPDGSHITLQPRSKLRYLSAFDASQREVFLEGQAFFEVHRDVNRPFLVYTGEVVTRVLGTSFTVKAMPFSDNIIVAVKTGKVSVYTRDEIKQSLDKKNETILVPNQQAVYNRQENKVSRTLVEVPQPVIEEVVKMHFDDAPVAEIFEALSRIYGVEVVYDANTLSKCTLTTSVLNGGIFNRLDIICKAIGATYTVEETRIRIEASGCD